MKLVLSLLPDGKGILTTEDNLSQAAAEELRHRYLAWSQSEAGLIVLAGCRVLHISELVLDLDREGITVAR